MPTNFLLASSGVIPLLALTLMVELRQYEMPPVTAEVKAYFGRRLWVIRGVALASFALAVFWTTKGEWVCLRSLEVGHVVHDFFGNSGTGAVWTAMGLLASLVVLGLLYRIIGLAPDWR